MKMNRYFFWVLTLVLLLTMSISSMGSAAEWPFRDGEVISLVVPFGPGGGFDRVTRLIAPTFDKILKEMSGDKDISVIVENISGAGGRIAYEDVYNSPPDGTKIVLIGGTAGALMQVEGAKFDLTKFTYIGQVNQSDYGMAVRSNINVNNFNDFIMRSRDLPILMGDPGFGGGVHISSIQLDEILAEDGIDFEIDYVHFKSSTEVFASMQRNEAEAYWGSVDSILPFLSEGYAKLIGTMAKERSKYFPQVPTLIEEAAQKEDDEVTVAVAKKITDSFGSKRIYVTTPNIPEEIANILREAFKQTLNEPEVLVRAKVAKLPIYYLPPEEARNVLMTRLENIKKYLPAIQEQLKAD